MKKELKIIINGRGIEMSPSNIVENFGILNGNIEQCNTNAEKHNFQKEKNASQKMRKDYDVALSYASEQQVFVNRVRKILSEEGLHVFYAPDCEQEYKAQDMFEKFYKIFRYQSKFTACFISKEYLEKDYTMQEYEASYLKNRDTGENRVIIVNFDGSKIPYLDPDIKYIDARNIREVQVADHILNIVKKSGESAYE